MDESMKTKIKVLLAGRSKKAISDLKDLIAVQERLDVTTRHILNGHADPLYGLEEVPDLLVLHVNGLEGGEIEALIERPATSRPPLLVVSDSGDAAVMRLAMKAGARDFLPHTESADVCESVTAICDELTAASTDSGEMIAVINAKGGSGATFLSCNIAHMAVCVSGDPTALVSLDMQFPTLPSYFDIKMRHGLMHAIDTVDELDAVALDAILASHESGLKILAANSDDFRFSYDDQVTQCSKLFNTLLDNYRHVIVDVPRRLTEINAEVVSRATRVVLVVQQSLPHVHDAMRLQQLLRDELGVFEDRLQFVVNRFQKNAEISLDDMKKALGFDDVVTVPNDFKNVSESINLGVPMYDHARQSAVTKALVALQSRVVGYTDGGAAATNPGKLTSLIQRSPLQQLFRGK
jgi:pilus assembly protein CpaE